MSLFPNPTLSGTRLKSAAKLALSPTTLSGIQTAKKKFLSPVMVLKIHVFLPASKLLCWHGQQQSYMWSHVMSDVICLQRRNLQSCLLL